MNLACVPPAQAAQAWGLVGHLIAEAMRGDHDVSVVHGDVTSGRSLLWLAIGGDAIHAAAVTEINEIAGRRICTIVACGGEDMSKWLHLIEGLEDYARRESCVATRINGRKGWARALAGYDCRYIVLEKAL